MTTFEKITNNVLNGDSKTYATLDNAIKQIKKFEEKYGMKLDFLPVMNTNGRVSIAINANRSYYIDKADQIHSGPFMLSTLIHSTKGWFIFN